MQNGWISESENILEIPELKDLRDKIQIELNHFGYEDLGIEKSVSLNISRSWAIKHQQKDWGQRHLHTNCLFSGIYYLEVNSKSGDITFEGNSCFQTSLIPTLKNFNQFTSENLNITPQTEYLFIFPSQLIHSVGTNLSPHERFCISFDVTID